VIRAGIIGAGGYTGGELLRLLVRHPRVELAFVQSHSQDGKSVPSVHAGLFGLEGLRFCAKPNLSDAALLFLCMSHGQSSVFLRENPLPETMRCIDLGNDFRLDPSFIYGLPELNREVLCQATRIANPGCFATAIQLALLPLAGAGLLQGPIHVHAITGSTGAGQALSETTHFSWRHANMSVYKAFSHQHLPEIHRSLGQLQDGFSQDIHFVPIRGDFTRGILASVYLECLLPEEDLLARYQTFYQAAPFTQVILDDPHVKMVVQTNYCAMQLKKHGKQLHIISVLDNLLKGASGQAVQNMNLMYGLGEEVGLDLKGAAY